MTENSLAVRAKTRALADSIRTPSWAESYRPLTSTCPSLTVCPALTRTLPSSSSMYSMTPPRSGSLPHLYVGHGSLAVDREPGQAVIVEQDVVFGDVGLKASDGGAHRQSAGGQGLLDGSVGYGLISADTDVPEDALGEEVDCHPQKCPDQKPQAAGQAAQKERKPSLSRDRQGDAVLAADPPQGAGGGEAEAEGDAAVPEILEILVGEAVAAADLQEAGSVVFVGTEGAVAHEEVGEGGDHTATSPSSKLTEQIYPSMPTAPAR